MNVGRARKPFAWLALALVAATPRGAGAFPHVVQAGETLWMLSARLQAAGPARRPRPDAPLAREKKGVVGRLFAAVFAGVRSRIARGDNGRLQ